MSDKDKEVKEVELTAEQVKTNEFIEKVNALVKEYGRNLNPVINVVVVPEETPDVVKEDKK